MDSDEWRDGSESEKESRVGVEKKIWEIGPTREKRERRSQMAFG